jgi:hypothetical protein
VRRGLVAIAVVIVVVLGASFAVYRRQVISYVTHLKGGPSTTWAYEVHDPPAEFHLAVAGDVGEPGDRIDETGLAVARVAQAEPFDALLLTGDNVYPDGDPAGLADTVFGPFSDVLDEGTDLLAVVGNHDAKGVWADAQLAALGMAGRHWVARYGDVVVVGLDSTDLGADQLAFLDDELGASTSRWRIVAIHHPPYSAGYQGSSEDVRDALAPILERHGVQLVISGHDHDYQRSMPIGGVTYVVSGAGALTRRTGEDDFTAVAYSWHHFVDVAIIGDRLVLRAVGQDGSVFDEATIGSRDGSSSVTPTAYNGSHDAAITLCRMRPPRSGPVSCLSVRPRGRLEVAVRRVDGHDLGRGVRRPGA